MTQAFPGAEDTRTVSEVDAHVKGADRDALLALNAELLEALERLANFCAMVRLPSQMVPSCETNAHSVIAKAKGAQ